MIGGPPNDISRLNSLLGGQPADYGEFVVDCGSVKHMPNVQVTFGGQTFDLKPEKYILMLKDTPYPNE